MIDKSDTFLAKKRIFLIFFTLFLHFLALFRTFLKNLRFRCENLPTPPAHFTHFSPKIDPFSQPPPNQNPQPALLAQFRTPKLALLMRKFLTHFNISSKSQNHMVNPAEQILAIRSRVITSMPRRLRFGLFN